MAQRQIAARLSGDDYQARFFWYQAAQLLFYGSNVARVIIEHDEAGHIDDVAVYFRPPGRLDSSSNSIIDFYQVKYHVDQRDAYCSDSLIDPSFIGSSTKSLLQRFFETYLKLKDEIPWFTLNLVSNWIWKAEDNLAKSVRDSGALPDEFFIAKYRSRLGKIRNMWISHLQTDEETFVDFGRRLRLKLNYFGLYDINTALSDRLFRAGLTPLGIGSLGSPYDDLARKFITSGNTSFDADSLHCICQRENLIQNSPIPRGIKTIGIRSFIPFAENLENEADYFVCVSDQFDGRHARTDQSWKNATISIKKFLESLRGKLNDEHRVLLDCHSSLAVLAGYLITSRVPVFPAGPRPKLERQKPSYQENIGGHAVWTARTTSIKAGASDLAVVISVTHRVSPQVIDFLRNQRYEVGDVLELIPITGLGPSSVRDADHAFVLATSLIQIIRDHQNKGKRTLVFISAPNFLSYFIGQQVRAIGEIDLFEYDFDGLEPRTYRPSISLPLSI
jgi:hypothetical protein